MYSYFLVGSHNSVTIDVFNYNYLVNITKMINLRMDLGFVFLLIIVIITCQEYPPQVVLISQSREPNMTTLTCVASGDATESALVIMSKHTGVRYRNESKSFYISKGRKTIKEVINNLSVADSLGKFETSGVHKIAPVVDTRWEDFPMYFNSDSVKINKTDKYIGLSIRSSNVSIYLCSNKTLLKQTHCYFIGMTASPNGTKTSIRKCVHPLIKNNETCFRYRQLQEVNDTGHQYLDENKWKHFTLELADNNVIRLWTTERKDAIFSFNSDSDIVNYIHMMSTKNIQWKLHRYEYLQLDKYRHQIAMFRSNFTGDLCLLLYVTMCPECSITLTIKNEDVDLKNHEIQGESGQFAKWKQEKLIISSVKDELLWLYVKLDNKYNAADPFWAMDNTIRKCSVNEARSVEVSIDTQKLSGLSVYCQPLQYRNWAIQTEGNGTDYYFFNQIVRIQLHRS